jgi:hypothetical protein
MIHSTSIHCKEASHGRNRNQRTIGDTARAFGDSTRVTGAPGADHPARVADSQRIADPGGITPNGDEPMMISSVVARGSASAASTGAPESVDDAQATSAEEAQASVRRQPRRRGEAAEK